MIRGSIEIVQRTQIAGWIYAETGSVRDRLILAFVGDRCVGAGKVECFRKDLFDAQLGDGYCGFDFFIKLDDEESTAAVTVKLQNSDAALIQRHARLVGQDELRNETPEHDLGAIAPAMIPWMQDRGWLEQYEFDFLRAVQTLGAYERGLRPARRPNADLPPALKPDHVVQELLGLYCMASIDVTTRRVVSISDLALAGSPMHGDGVSLMALWSSDRCRIALDERSHVRGHGRMGEVMQVPAPGSIEYAFGPDRILFVHRHARFAPISVAPRDGVTVFTATVRDNVIVAHTRRAERAA